MTNVAVEELERPLYVYELVVDIPPDCLVPGFAPAAWREEYQDGFHNFAVFSWPPRRRYFKFESAQRRARLLSKWGARVIIERRPVGHGDDVAVYEKGEAVW